MILTTPEILWHGKEPIFSIEFHHGRSEMRLATAGADHTVKVWKIQQNGDRLKPVFLSSLERHTKTVNVARFSPCGQVLASGGDDCVVHLWRQDVEKSSEGNIAALEHELNQETWNVVRTMRGHVEDVYDMCWSCDSRHMVTGSVDNTAIVWDSLTGDKLAILREGNHYIQGVSWDPIGNSVATLCADRTLRVYGGVHSHRPSCLHAISKFTPPVKEDGGPVKSVRMFLDESISSFFRRLSFSPDGSLIVAPGGRIEEGKSSNVTWIFTRDSLPRPVVCLPCSDKSSAVVRFCPTLFQLQPGPSLVNLQYRMVFAVACVDKLMIYDTQQTLPIGFVSDIHYSSITDLAWSDDGRMLAVSSSDGYCSLLAFNKEELGLPLPNDLIPSHLQLVHQRQNATLFSPNPSSPLVNGIKLRHSKPTTVKLSDGESGDGGCSPETVQPMTLQHSESLQNEGSEESMDFTRSSDTAGLLCNPIQQDGKQKRPRRVCFTTLPPAKPFNDERVLTSKDAN